MTPGEALARMTTKLHEQQSLRELRPLAANADERAGLDRQLAALGIELARLKHWLLTH